MEKRKITIASPQRALIIIALIGVAIGYIFGGAFFSDPKSQSEANIQESEAPLIDSTSGDSKIPDIEDDLEEIFERESAEVPDDQLAIVENISVDDDPSLGEADAPVTIIEFSDYQCPFCKRFYEETQPTILEEYVNTGKARYIFRDFPLGSHNNAIPAAVAANCAGEQDQYWEMHDLLFERQDDWSFEESPNESFKTYAQELSLNTEDFELCTTSAKQEVEAFLDQADGLEAGVEYTPTVFINGKKVIGAQPLETYIAIIEAELLNQQ